MPDPHITIPDEEPIVQYEVGGTPDASFAIPFVFFDSAGADVEVYNDGVLVSSNDYTIAGTAGTSGGYDGGTLTLDVAVSNTTITIIRNVPIERTTDFPLSGPFNIAALNTQLDKIFAIEQQNRTAIDRAISIPVADINIETELPPAADRANKALVFDADGNAGVSVDDYEDQVADVTAQAAAAAASATAAAASATSASSSAAAASSSASSASTSASSASTSASAASTSATNAATSATNAASSATTASNAATAAQTAETNAETAETNAETAETNAETAATNAAASASSASTSASSASTSASSASTSASSASTSASSASTSATNAAASAAAAASTLASALWRGTTRLTSASSPYTVLSSDNGKLLVCDTSSGAITINLPQISGITLPFNIGVLLDTGSNNITVARGGTDTIDGSTSKTFSVVGQGSELIADSAPSPDEWETIDFGAQGGNLTIDRFSGTGAQTAFPMSVDPGTENNTWVYVSGVYQQKNTYSTSGTTLTFSSAPPSGTDNVEVIIGTTLSVGTPSDNTVTTAKVQDDAITYAKMQNVSATSRILGRKTSGAGDVEETTLSEILDFIGSAAQGDILYRGASAWARLGAGTSGHFLKTQGTGANPTWAAPSSAGVLKKQIFTANGTFTTPSGTTTSTVYKFTIVGGGGAGGDASTAAGAAGGGGGGGETAVRWTTGHAPSTGFTVTVGTAGTASSVTGIGAGGTTVDARGGSAGTSSTAASSTKQGGNGGGGGANADYFAVGAPGGSSISGASLAVSAGGHGGASSQGGGGAGAAGGSAAAGGAAGGGAPDYGGGGGGAVRGTSNQTGGPGAPGIVIVEWIE